MVRLANVPFKHSKPTWGDVIVVVPNPDANGELTWDSGGVAFSRIGDRILEDSGRWAMIVDYAPTGVGVEADAETLRAIELAGATLDAVTEGRWAASGDDPGRAYLAVPDEADPDHVMEAFAAAAVPGVVMQIHPVLAPRPRRTPKKPAAADQLSMTFNLASDAVKAPKAKAAKAPKAKAAKAPKAKVVKAAKAKVVKAAKAAKPVKRSAKPAKRSAKPAARR
jgi:hypothetical protein